jgi:hypothetical protein
VVFHFLDKDFKMQNLLARIKRVKKTKTGENIIEAVISVIKGMVSGEQLGFFIKDNADENGIAIRAIFAHLCPDLKDPDFKRVKCFGHIINLTAKVFFFNKNTNAFKKDFRIKKKLFKFKAVRKL